MKHLRYFEALARIGHFGRAAESCAISQPALSVQIRELEELVGVPLVERGGRRIRLTGLGEEFAERTRAILRSVDELEDLGRAAHGPIAGRLRLQPSTVDSHIRKAKRRLGTTSRREAALRAADDR